MRSSVTQRFSSGSMTSGVVVGSTATAVNRSGGGRRPRPGRRSAGARPAGTFEGRRGRPGPSPARVAAPVWSARCRSRPSAAVADRGRSAWGVGEKAAENVGLRAAGRLEIVDDPHRGEVTVEIDFPRPGGRSGAGAVRRRRCARGARWTGRLRPALSSGILARFIAGHLEV